MRELGLTLIAIFLLTPFLWSEEKEEVVSAEDLPLRRSARKMLDEGEGLKHRNALAGEVTTLRAECPVCNEKFSAYHMTEGAADKGIDRDLCRHASHISSLDLDIWACTNCGFSHFKSFFNQKLNPPLPEELRKKQEAFLARAFVEVLGVNVTKIGFKIDQQDIPRSIKYTLMENLLPQLGLPWKVKADFHLRKAWSERLRGCETLRSPYMSGALGSINSALKSFEKRHDLKPIMADPAQVLLFLDHYLEKDKSLQGRFLVHVFRASQLNRLGFLHGASEELKKAILMNNPKPIRELAVFRNRLLESQIKHLKEAVIATKESLRVEEHSRDELQSTIYMLGELQRRIGLFAEARVWFKTYLDLGENDLTVWVKEQLSALPKSVGLAPDSEKVLAQTVSDRFLELKKEDEKDDPSQITKEQVRRWLSEINIAAVTYNRKYKLDPENLQELFQLGYLKGQPDLELQHLRFFQLKSNSGSPLASTRYTVNCLLPLFDKEGSFMASSSRGRLIRTPTNGE
jgi:tetratricopeptide (TPR) repeat protein